MSLLTLIPNLAKKDRKIPLRLILVVPFVIQIFAAVGLTGWLSLRNGQQAVNEVARELRREMTARIEAEIRLFLAAPHTLNQINVAAIKREKIDAKNIRAVEQILWDNLQIFDSIGAVGFENKLGDLIAVSSERSDRGRDYSIEYADAATGGEWNGYQVDSQHQMLNFSRTVPRLDTRRISGYQKAQKMGKSVWSEIYISLGKSSNKSLVITAAHPLYNEIGDLEGVASVTLYLAQLGEFLSQLNHSDRGETFIIERTGYLVGSSTKIEPILIQNGKQKRLKATNSSNVLIEASANYLEQVFDDLGEINRPQQFDFLMDGKRQFLQVTPLRDSSGIDWLIVVAVPESDFMAQIQKNRRTTILLCLASLAIATLMGTIVSRWITQPILRLTEASKAISNGNLNRKVEGSRIDDLSILAQSFNQMAAQLKAYFAELEIRVERRTAELKEAKRVADTANQAKSEFLANMSHELRTPLNGILGYAQILGADKEANPKQKDAIGIIYQCGIHLLTLINDILDFSKIEAMKMELSPKEVEFVSFLKGITEIFHIRASEKEISFTFQPSIHLPPVILVDEKRLRQVLINLLGNAIKFTDKGGVMFKILIIEDEREKRENKVTITHSRLTPTKIRFQIEDTGVGIAPQALDQIFLPFEQVGASDRRTEGSGLGLAIGQKLVQMMGSKIEVQSQLNRGSIFRFDLEVIEVSELNYSSVSDPLNKIVGYKGSARKILVVDERWENRSIIIKFLKPLGFEIGEAGNGQEGLEQAIAYHPDLIITDLVMPILDGFEMTRRLRSLSEIKDTILIASSASVFNFDRQKSLDYGCNDFIPKPVQLEELLKKLEEHLGLEWVYEQRDVLGRMNASANNIFGERNPVPSEDRVLPAQKATDIVAPPPEELIRLFNAARIGDIEGVEEEAIRLRNLDPQYVPFATKLLHLAEEFEEKEIQKFVKHYMAGQ